MNGSINSPGVIVDDYQHLADQVYVTPEELQQSYGLVASEQQIRMAMVLINEHCNRRTLWPSEYEQRLLLTHDRTESHLSVRPVLRIVAAAGRYTYGRRDRRLLNQTANYLATLAAFGPPTAFINIDVNQIEFFSPTGEVWFPTGLFLIGYGEVQVKYLAGFIDIPERAKLAVAMLVNAICTKGEPDRQSFTSGRISRTFATPSFFSRDIKDLLSPFVVRSYA